MKRFGLPRRGIAGHVTALLALIVLSLTTPSGPASANLVNNGSFEELSSTAATGLYHLCDNDGATTCVSAITGWAVTCSTDGCSGSNSPGSVLLGGDGGAEFNGFTTAFAPGLYGKNALANGVPNSPDSGNFIAIDGGADYSQSISQMITGLTAGRDYTVTFYQAASQQPGKSGATTEDWEVSLGSETEYSTTMDNASESFTGWGAQSLTFLATGSSELLTFLAQGTPDGEPPVVLLDGVAINVPEPASLALLGLGAASILAVRRRRAARSL